jgi:hypothetical protein
MNVMVVILTNFNSDRKCLVNMSNVETCYVVWDTKEQKYKTKFCFRGNESYIFVEESLQVIHKLVVNMLLGVYQSSDWETKSIDEHLETYLRRPELTKDLFEDFKY